MSFGDLSPPVKVNCGAIFYFLPTADVARVLQDGVWHSSIISFRAEAVFRHVSPWQTSFYTYPMFPPIGCRSIRAAVLPKTAIPAPLTIFVPKSRRRRAVVLRRPDLNTWRPPFGYQLFGDGSEAPGGAEDDEELGCPPISNRRAHRGCSWRRFLTWAYGAFPWPMLPLRN